MVIDHVLGPMLLAALAGGDGFSAVEVHPSAAAVMSAAAKAPAGSPAAAGGGMPPWQDLGAGTWRAAAALPGLSRRGLERLRLAELRVLGEAAGLPEWEGELHGARGTEAAKMALIAGLLGEAGPLLPGSRLGRLPLTPAELAMARARLLRVEAEVKVRQADVSRVERVGKAMGASFQTKAKTLGRLVRRGLV